MNKKYQAPECIIIPFEVVLMTVGTVEGGNVGGEGHGIPDGSRQMNDWDDDE